VAASKAKAQAEEAANAKAGLEKAAQEKAAQDAQQAKEVKMLQVKMAPQREKAKVRAVAGKSKVGTGGGVAAKQVVSAQEVREEEMVERKKAAAEHKRAELEAKVASLRKLLRQESKESKIMQENGLQALGASDPKTPAPAAPAPAPAPAPAAPAAKTTVSGNKETVQTVKVHASGAAKAGSAREDHTSAQALKEALKVANVLEKSSP
jgi:hypothetical protein